MNEKTVTIPNISCNHCVMHVENAVNSLKNAEAKVISLEDKKVRIKWKEPTKWNNILSVLEEINYPVKE
jgi:copper chaperone